MNKHKQIETIAIYPCDKIYIYRRNIKTGKRTFKIYNSKGQLYDARIRRVLSIHPNKLDYLYNETYRL